jgi:hypothetical protein
VAVFPGKAIAGIFIRDEQRMLKSLFIAWQVMVAPKYDPLKHPNGGNHMQVE